MSKFPIFNPISLQYLKAIDRSIVHTTGHWHKGIQAHLVKRNGNTFDVYVQKRSSTVDINMFKTDQSLASQMITQDKLDVFNTLKRGLKEELGIEEYRTHLLPLNLRIIKRYDYDHSIINKEIIALFLCESSQEPDYSKCTKVQEGYWISWDDFIQSLQSNPQDFTKTASFYMNNPDLVSYIHKATIQFLNNKPLPEFIHRDKIILGYYPLSGENVYHIVDSKSELVNLITKYD